MEIDCNTRIDEAGKCNLLWNLDESSQFEQVNIHSGRMIVTMTSGKSSLQCCNVALFSFYFISLPYAVYLNIHISWNYRNHL